MYEYLHLHLSLQELTIYRANKLFFFLTYSLKITVFLYPIVPQWFQAEKQVFYSHNTWDADWFESPSRSQVCNHSNTQDLQLESIQYLTKKKAEAVREVTTSHTQTATGCQTLGVGGTKLLWVFSIMQYLTFSELKAMVKTQWSQKGRSKTNTAPATQ